MQVMKIKYFEDTDTALVEFTEKGIAETREISENIYVDLDQEGNPVSITIEHAGEHANMHELAFQRMVKQSA